MDGKNIKIQVWTDLYYAKFIAIWRPEEESDYVAPVPDPRPEQERNVPHLLILDSMYKGRDEVVGNNPVAPSQHPMPPEYMKRYIRHISYCFANGYGVFVPPTKAAAETFLAKQKVGYTMNKEIKVTVSPVQGSMTLKEFRDSLEGYTAEQLKKIKVRTLGEHPDDAHANKLEDYIHTFQASTTEQYFTVTKLMNVYDVEDTTINNTPLSPATITNGQPPGTLSTAMGAAEAGKTMDAIATNNADAAIMNTAGAMNAPVAGPAGAPVSPSGAPGIPTSTTPPTAGGEPMPPGTVPGNNGSTTPNPNSPAMDATKATVVTTPVSKEEAMAQTIKDLQAKLAKYEPIKA